MKKILSIAFILLISNVGYSQGKQVKPKDIVVYQIENESDSFISCSQKEIKFKIVGWEFDSCNFYANKFHFEFEIKNNTNQPIMCNKTLVCWNDSGFTRPSMSDPIRIDGGQTGKILVQVYPHQQKSRTRTTTFTIMQENQTLLIPLTLTFTDPIFKECFKSK